VTYDPGPAASHSPGCPKGRHAPHSLAPAPAWARAHTHPRSLMHAQLSQSSAQDPKGSRRHSPPHLRSGLAPCTAQQGQLHSHTPLTGLTQGPLISLNPFEKDIFSPIWTTRQHGVTDALFKTGDGGRVVRGDLSCVSLLLVPS